MVLKQDLHGLKTASNSLHKYFGDFLRYLGFTPSKADQYLWITKYVKNEEYDYISTHVDDFIIAAKNPSKYTNDIEMHFRVREITYSPNNHLLNELSRVGNCIRFSSKKYANEIMSKHQKTLGDPKKDVLPTRVKEHPELDDSPSLIEKEHKKFQHTIGVCQWLVVSGIFDLAYFVSLLSRLLAAPWVGHLELARRIFGYLKN